MQAELPDRTVDRSAMSAAALSSMFLAVAGLRNLRSALVMLGCFALAASLGWGIGTLFGPSVGSTLLGGLVALVGGFAGVHAAGVLLMDQARQLQPRSVVSAVTYGVLCVPKTLGLLLLLMLVGIAMYAVVALVFWICKMPALGPLLYAVALPASVVITGAVTSGLFLALLLALAAIWEGCTVMAAMARVLTVVRLRLVEGLLLLVVVLLLAGAVGSVISGVLLTGLLPSIGLSGWILPSSSMGSLGSLGSIFMGSGSGGFGGGGFGGGGFGGSGGSGAMGYVVAGAFGTTMLWLMALTLTLQVGLLGVNLAYLRLTEGLDASETEGALQAHMAQAKRKAAELAAKAKEASEQARAQAEQAMAQQRQAAAARAAAAAQTATAATAPPILPPAQATPLASAASPACPACHRPVAPADAFCGHCGHRLDAGG